MIESEIRLRVKYYIMPDSILIKVNGNQVGSLVYIHKSKCNVVIVQGFCIVYAFVHHRNIIKLNWISLNHVCEHAC